MKNNWNLRTPRGAKRFYSSVNFTKKTLKEEGFITVNDGYISLTSKGEKLFN